MSISSVKTGAVGVSLLAGNTSYDPAATFLIERITATGGSTTLTFTSIPSTYKHLQIRGIGKSASSGEYAGLIRVNTDSGNNYSTHTLYGNGSSAGASGTASNNNVGGIRVAQSTETNTFGAVIADFHDYADTTKYKTIRTFTGADGNVSNTNYRIMLASGVWLNTAAITSISLLQLGNWAAGSTFALYGMVG